MLQECLMSDCQRKFSMENFWKETVLIVVKRNATKTPLKPRFWTNSESWEQAQAAQDRTEWRCSINKGATQFEAKRICEDKRKRKEGNQEPRDHQSEPTIMYYLQPTF